MVAEGTIDRTAAAAYLTGARNLSNFYDLIVNGTLNYQMPTNQVLVSGHTQPPDVHASAVRSEQ